jgi:hypothetical protein
MSEDDKTIQLLIVDYLVTHVHCGGCGHPYTVEDLQVRRRGGDLWLATMVCRRCGLQRLVVAAVNPGYAKGMGQASDTGSEEEHAVAVGEPISSEDVLDLHRFLKDFDGDVLQLLRDL